jgi:hypothetical protein
MRVHTSPQVTSPTARVVAEMGRGASGLACFWKEDEGLDVGRVYILI